MTDDEIFSILGWSVSDGNSDLLDRIKRCIAVEREACARIVEQPHYKPAVRSTLKERAAMIRARGDQV